MKIRHFRAQAMVAAVAAIALFAGVACRNEDDPGPVLDVPDFDATAQASAFDPSLSQLAPDATTAPATRAAARSKDKDDATATGRRLASQVTTTATAVGTALSPATRSASTATATRAPRTSATSTTVPPTRTPASSAPAATATTASAPSPTPVPPTPVPATPTAVPAAPTPAPANPPAGGSTVVSRLSIASLGVDYPIEQLATTDGGTRLDTPHNATGAIGWYQIDYLPDFASPGTGGNAVFSAHINYNGVDGPFANLSNIGSGAEIAVTMADGVVHRYQVFAIRGYVVDANYVTDERPLINMDHLVYTPDRPPGEEWITLLTCSCDPGRVIVAPGAIYGDCVDRDVVIARLVS